MKVSLLVIALCMALLCVPALAEMSNEDIQALPTTEVESKLPGEHPSAYYAYAARLYRDGRKDDAVFWYYVGSLRFRFHLRANPNTSPDGDPALMASLNSVVGQPINEYAGGNPQMWVAQIDRALRWDADTRNDFTSGQKYSVEWQGIRAGLSLLRAKIASDTDTIRKQRIKAGLENR